MDLFFLVVYVVRPNDSGTLKLKCLGECNTHMPCRHPNPVFFLPTICFHNDRTSFRRLNLAIRSSYSLSLAIGRQTYLASTWYFKRLKQ